ncbi:hypothetical protein [Sediminibacillus massiliensis]|uniref:hypothetical protein n=1 Tax=Sediminibacillus massiliensis TaxID=1926277 RepID=UPI0009887F2D|nr:hypothetical protein [Sediminibacillus massiliensis]
MRTIRNLIIILSILGTLGYIVVHFGADFVANLTMDKVREGMDLNSEELNGTKTLEKNPELQAFLADVPEIDQSSLPFDTKEEAVKKLAPKFSIGELQELREYAGTSMTEDQQEELLNKLKEKLTKQEIDAVKVILYKELYQQ